MTNQEQILAKQAQALADYQQAIIAHNNAAEEMKRAIDNLTKTKTAWDNACTAFNEIHSVKTGSGLRLNFAHSNDASVAA